MLYAEVLFEEPELLAVFAVVRVNTGGVVILFVYLSVYRTELEIFVFDLVDGAITFLLGDSSVLITTGSLISCSSTFG